MPGEIVAVSEDERGRRSDPETSEDERPRTRIRSLKKKAMSASTRFTHTLRNCGKRVVDCQFVPFSIEDVRDAEKEDAVDAFRCVLIAKDQLPAAHDDYHIMLRLLKASNFDLDKAVQMWKDMLKWRNENRVDYILQIADGDLSPADSGSDIWLSTSKNVQVMPWHNKERLRETTSINSLVQPVVAAASTGDASSINCTNGLTQRGQMTKIIHHLANLIIHFIVKLFACMYLILPGLGRFFKVKSSELAYNCNTQLAGINSQERHALHGVEEGQIHPYLQRLQNLEASVAELFKKPTRIPPEKEDMIYESLSRIKSIEYDLQKTKKVLLATASKQVELAESLESLKDGLKGTSSCWLRQSKSYHGR